MKVVGKINTEDIGIRVFPCSSSGLAFELKAVFLKKNTNSEQLRTINVQSIIRSNALSV